MKLAAHLTLSILVAALSIIGCASKKTVRDRSAKREMLFPYGSYQHDVDLTIQIPSSPADDRETRPPKKVHFRGVVKLGADLISMVALSPMNTTLFRIHEDRKTGKIESEIYIDSLKKMQTQMLNYYVLIRKILTTPLSDNSTANVQMTKLASGPGAGLPERMSVMTDAGQAQVQFSGYDSNRVPDRITVENPKFHLDVKVVGYEL